MIHNDILVARPFICRARGFLKQMKGSPRFILDLFYHELTTQCGVQVKWEEVFFNVRQKALGLLYDLRETVVHPEKTLEIPAEYKRKCFN